MRARLTSHALPQSRYRPGAGQPRPQALGAAGFAFGIDLFNAGFLWEAHEVWEPLWRELSVDAPAARGLRGLIQVAAAGLKAGDGRRAGVRSLGAKALGELERAGPRLVLEGWAVDLEGWCVDFAAWLEAAADEAELPFLAATRSGLQGDRARG